ncbi:MAG: glycoside hydrolase family 3 C-terminal domain-containing protein, partial [Acidobacteriota bacterium]
AAGLDLEMPGNPLSPPQVVEAVRSGRLAEADLDRAVARVLQLVERRSRQTSAGAAGGEAELEALHRANHDLAREVAAASMVLLENDGVLPLSAERGRRVGVVGRNAFAPRIQGIGSSQIQTTRLDVPWRELEARGTEHGLEVTAWGAEYAEDGLGADARAALSSWLADVDQVVVFAGQKASHDAEAWDRPSMALAPADRELMAVARDSGKPFAAVVSAGGAVELRGLGADAVLFTWLGGQAFGGAVAEVLLGVQSPGGRLSETFAPVSDHPSDLNFPAGPRRVIYGERMAVGYRHFQGRPAREVDYPFGHGLSYTRFEYRDAAAPATLGDGSAGLDVRVDVANVGERRGSETVQVYLRPLDYRGGSTLELVAFAKGEIAPGDVRTFEIPVAGEQLARWSEIHGRWVIEPGRYELLVGSSAAVIRRVLPLEIETGTVPRRYFSTADVIGDIVEDPRGLALVDFLLAQIGQEPLSRRPEDDFFAAIFRNMPFKKLAAFSGGNLSLEALDGLLELVNSDLEPGQVRSHLEAQRAAAGESPGAAPH